MSDILSKIIYEIENQHLKAKFVNLKVLEIIKNDFEKNYQSGLIDKLIYNRYLTNFDYSAHKKFANIKSILSVAVPRPQMEAEFCYNNQNISVLIPPTYTGYNSIPEKILNILSNISSKNNFQFVRTSLPEKSIAVRCGLACYGKNNITYVKGFGSFYQLVSFYTSLDAENNDPVELKMLERCNNCTACIKVCPTNAITTNRFLINAERCLTFFNENTGEFPDWIKKYKHNSLVGCILCQRYCPEDKNLKEWIEKKSVFTEDETEAIFNTRSFDFLSEEVKKKLFEIDLIDTHIEFDTFKRNLKILFEKEIINH